jgi:hypothetical protein
MPRNALPDGGEKRHPPLGKPQGTMVAVRSERCCSAGTVPHRLAAIDLEPASEVRPMDASTRRLAIDTGLRDAAAEAAWLTVSDAAGTVYFEGRPGVDGCLEVSFQGTPCADGARVLLETATSHRQAEIVLGEGRTYYAFARA